MEKRTQKMVERVAARVLGMVVLLVVGLGVLAPQLVSAQSTLAVVFGFAVVAFVVVSCWKLTVQISRIIVEANLEENVNDE